MERTICATYFKFGPVVQMSFKDFVYILCTISLAISYVLHLFCAPSLCSADQFQLQ